MSLNPLGSYWLFSIPDALSDGVSWGRGGGDMAAKRGHVEGSGGSQLKAVAVKNQAKWRANCCFECSMRWHVDSVSFEQFTLANSKGKTLGWRNHNLVCYLCDEAALWKSIAVALWIFFLQSFLCRFFILMIYSIKNACLLLAIPLNCYFT